MECGAACEVKIWSTMDPKLWQTVLEPSQRSSVLSIEASYVQGIMFNHFNHVQSDSNWNLLETGLRQGSFINLRLTCKPSSLIPAAWKWETSMSFAAALMLSCCSLGYQRYNQECKPERQSATNDQVIQVSSSTSDQPVINLKANSKGVDNDGATTGVAFGSSAVKVFVTAPISIAAVRYLPHLSRLTKQQPLWSCKTLLRCCVRCFMILRRTVDPTSGQYIVLDCSSGCSENSTAYLVPWIHLVATCAMLRPSSWWQLDPLGSTRRVPSGPVGSRRVWGFELWHQQQHGESCGGW